ncbi:MAG: glycosyl hydrolase 108 family protein, partial [Shewanella algae]
MSTIDYFPEAYAKTMGVEGLGVRTNTPGDYGGDTFSGISRTYWPEWPGWEYLDQGDTETALS